ncbi:MAG: VOC family protein, partial [Actinomycetota bacterium]
MRLQLALNVRDLDEAVEFYSTMFDAQPTKRRPGYANFAIEQPPLKLVLFEKAEAAAGPAGADGSADFAHLNHLGVEVET